MSTFHQIESPNLLVDGTITVLLRSGKHFTYRVYSPKWADNKRVVALLVGSDNTHSYKGFGFVNEGSDGAYITLWKKCRTEAFIKHAELLTGRADEHVDEWMQEGRCMKCGRKLTTPESLKAGIGPVCAGRG